MDRPTVLVIDYEPRNLAATVEPLTAAGYRVEVARDGLAGLDAYRRLQPSVVFMEAMLPKKHAFEVCQEIRRSHPGRQTRVFILGAPTIAQSQQSKAVHQYGADRFLSRPVDGPTLVALCSSVLPGPDAPEIPELDLLEPMDDGPGAAEREILHALEAPARPVERLDLSAMTEDDIMAQLDQLLPSVPVKPPPPAPPKAKAPVVAAPSPAAVRPPLPAPAIVAPVSPRVATPVPPQLPPPVLRIPSAEAAPAPAPTRSRAPMLAAGCVLAIAAAGSWMLFRPGAAPVPEPLRAVPFAEEAPIERPEAPPPAPPPPLEVVPSAIAAAPAPPPVEAETASRAPALHVADVSRAQRRTAPDPPLTKPAAPRQVVASPAPPPTQAAVVETPPKTLPAVAVQEEAPPAQTEPKLPLPLAPPRLEPLPVGSDAARPRISPDVFLRRTEAGSLVDLREVDHPPVALSRPAPAYPPAARQMRREGEIELRLLVDAQGQVASVDVVTGAAKSDLAAAAKRAVRSWKYRPAMKDGVPVQVRIVEKITFKL